MPHLLRDLTGVPAGPDSCFDKLSAEDFPRAIGVLEKAVAEGIAPGFVAGLWSDRDPDRLLLAALGSRRTSPTSLPMLPATIFDLASLTKVCATSLLAARLVERGWIRWDTRVAELLPGFRHSGIELRHLLSHTAGYPAWRPLWKDLVESFAPRPLHRVGIASRREAMRERVFRVELEAAPGERALYSDLSFLLLGFALEEASGMSLDRAVRDLVWGPMGISGFHYHATLKRPERDIRDEVAATELSPWHHVVLQGQVHDENCWAMGGIGGHAGVFGRAADVLKLARALFKGFLSPRVLRQMWSRVPEPPGCERTLGWDTPSGGTPSCGHRFSPGSVGHLGFTGTSLWIDPDAGLAVTLLSNRVHPSRENIGIRQLRPRFHDAIREDLLAERGE